MNNATLLGFVDEFEKIAARSPSHAVAAKAWREASSAASKADGLFGRIFRRGKLKQLKAAERAALDVADRALEKKTRLLAPKQLRSVSRPGERARWEIG